MAERSDVSLKLESERHAVQNETNFKVLIKVIQSK